MLLWISLRLRLWFGCLTWKRHAHLPHGTRYQLPGVIRHCPAVSSVRFLERRLPSGERPLSVRLTWTHLLAVIRRRRRIGEICKFLSGPALILILL